MLKTNLDVIWVPPDAQTRGLHNAHWKNQLAAHFHAHELQITLLDGVVFDGTTTMRILWTKHHSLMHVQSPNPIVINFDTELGWLGPYRNTYVASPMGSFLVLSVASLFSSISLFLHVPSRCSCARLLFPSSYYNNFKSLSPTGPIRCQNY
jgi:hypothetical protein